MDDENCDVLGLGERLDAWDGDFRRSPSATMDDRDVFAVIPAHDQRKSWAVPWNWSTTQCGFAKQLEVRPWSLP
jgi:hypothetical protein